MDLSTEIGGIKLKNPLMPASGPLTGDYERMMAIENTGVGCMVAKTISIKGAEVPRPCIYGGREYIMNSELWSEYPYEYWIDQILPDLRRDLKIPLLVSVGYTKEDMKVLIPKLQGFCDGFEVSTHYVGLDLKNIKETVHVITSLTDKPVFMKVSPHMPDPVEFAHAVKDNGAKGIVAMNSLGPAVKIDLDRRKVIAGNQKGEVWMSGPVIKPMALALVSRIKDAMPDFTVIGTGGISSAEDVVEFLLAGADAVQMLSAAMLKGHELYRRIIDDLSFVLEKHKFESVRDVIDTPLIKGEVKYTPGYPEIDDEKCRLCGLCAEICPYFALSIDGKVQLDKARCFGCGLCQSKCPTAAIHNVLY